MHTRQDAAEGLTSCRETNNEVVETYTISNDQTTEFRMILTCMIHAMKVVPEGSDIVFLTNVSYILQNFDKQPTNDSANADLISECIATKGRQHSVTVKLIPFHKYNQLQETHEMAHAAMLKLRNS